MADVLTAQGEIESVNENGIKLRGGGSWINFGNYYQGRTDFRQGDAVFVEYTEFQGERGVSYYVKSITVNGAQPAPAVPQPPSGPGPAYVGPPTAPMPSAPPSPAPQGPQETAPQIIGLPDRDVLIVRQTCLKAATEANNSTEHIPPAWEVALYAEELERWALRPQGEWAAPTPPPEDHSEPVEPSP